MKKIFISQPMNGLSNEEIKRNRSNAILKLPKFMNGESFEIIDSFFENAPHDATPLWYLSQSLELLSTADYAYFLEGWDTARGCKIENACAQEYNIPRIYEDNLSTSPSMIVELPTGRLIVEENPDPDYAGFAINFQTKDGDIAPIVLVESKAETDYKKIDVYTYADEYREDFTHKFILECERIEDSFNS